MSFAHFSSVICVMCLKNYVNFFHYIPANSIPKSDNLSTCTKTDVEKHRIPSTGHFFRNVNYGNHFVTIFSGIKTFSFPLFMVNLSLFRISQLGIDKGGELCYILFLKSYDERHAFPVRISERCPFGVRAPVHCPVRYHFPSRGLEMARRSRPLPRQ